MLKIAFEKRLQKCYTLATFKNRFKTLNELGEKEDVDDELPGIDSAAAPVYE
ncbi:hypothetical protein [Faecalispora sporosphaeroides]|jgi:hypothetical protein|uniref:hypothetical protein n=1 Tax=Faecalispora sporosphaeroides TaxID=1549 RepID=UPI0012B59BF9|nr:hypothetical protein [Faecalispora sporosphaeroides]